VIVADTLLLAEIIMSIISTIETAATTNVALSEWAARLELGIISLTIFFADAGVFEAVPSSKSAAIGKSVTSN